ncbi:MAG: D-aminoacylase [Deltaproteobacteria bacterium]|nr:D-aminoacylase [Deltaproteobacteria bacterium]
MFDYLFRQATVVDGSGGPPVNVDVAVVGERITAVGPGLPGRAATIIDAADLVLSPGFIDIHSHTDATIFKNPSADSKLLQGVTLEVTGNCGLGCFPLTESRRHLLQDFLKMHEFGLPEEGLDWKDMQTFADRLDGLGLGLNLAPLVAHGALRIAAMGSDDRPPEPGEMAEMKALLKEMLFQGAWGFSTGLIYPPGSYAVTDELIELSRVLVPYNALYASHIRGEGATLMKAIDEAIQIGRQAGVKVEVSHLKALGQANWGLGRAALDKLARARREGVDIAADQYPYEASQTALSVLVPAWAHIGGVAQMRKRLLDAQSAPRLKSDIKTALIERGGPSRIMIFRAGSEHNLAFSRKSLSEVAESWNLVPEDAVIRLLREDASVSAVYFSLSDDDVTAILQSDQVAIGSDGRALTVSSNSTETTHPRSYGTFPRVLGHFVREKGLLSLATAIYKMTALPASRLGLADRGLVRPGYAADLVLFDPSVVAARATFENPHQYPMGISLVMVNGKVAARNGNPTAERAGRVLRKIVEGQA